MKRKFKLITTIASLTAAIALLMFGVFAYAEKRAVEVTGSVAFTASAVDATVTVKQAVGADLATAQAALSLAETSFTHTFKSAKKNSGTALQDSELYEGLTGALNDEGNLVYIYSITVQNLSNFQIAYRTFIDADVTLPATGVTRTGSETLATLIPAAGTEGDTVTVLTVYYTVTPAAIPDVQSFGWTFGSAVELASTLTGFAA